MILCVLVFVFLDSNEIVDIEAKNLPESKRAESKVLFETVFEIIGRSTVLNISLESNFFQLGGNSLNSILTISKLREKGYSIDITDFISAKNFQEILYKMKPIENSLSNLNELLSEYRFTSNELRMEDRDKVIE